MLRRSGPSPNYRNVRYNDGAFDEEKLTASFFFGFVVDDRSGEIIEGCIRNQIIDVQKSSLKISDHRIDIYQRNLNEHRTEKFHQLRTSLERR